MFPCIQIFIPCIAGDNIPLLKGVRCYSVLALLYVCLGAAGGVITGDQASFMAGRRQPGFVCAYPQDRTVGRTEFRYSRTPGAHVVPVLFSVVVLV